MKGELRPLEGGAIPVEAVRGAVPGAGRRGAHPA